LDTAPILPLKSLTFGEVARSAGEVCLYPPLAAEGKGEGYDKKNPYLS